MEEEKNRELMKLLQDMEATLARHKHCQEQGARFSEDLYTDIAATTCKYFSQSPTHPALIIKSSLDEFELRETLAADKDVRFFAQGCYEELYDLMEDFLEHELPPDRELRYKKIEQPSFTDEAVWQNVKEMTQKFTMPDHADLRLLFKYRTEDALIEEVYIKFEIAIHKTFKKLALEYFPEIMQISAAGLREVDYSLYMQKQIIQDMIYVAMDSRVSVSAEVSVDDFDVSSIGKSPTPSNGTT